MISAQELRIGNFVQDHEGEFQKVLTIQVGWIRVKPDCGLALDLINGIPLTEEWLVKLGLISIELGYYQINEGVSIDVENQVRFESSWMTECLYVHRLQNLYYALTGQELEVSNG